MGISPFAVPSLGKFIPTRRHLACASAVVAVIAGPVSIAANAAHASTPVPVVAAQNAGPAKVAALAKPAAPAAPASSAPAAAQPAAAAPAPAAPAPAAPAPAAPAPAAPAPAAPAAPAPAAPAPAAPAPAAPAPAAPAPAAPVDPYASASIAQLEPTGLYGSQQHFTPNSDQMANAKAIVDAAKRRGMSPYAAVIAVATSMQETTLRNLKTAVDHDSLGLFQQRPSMGWGTASQLTDPSYAANAFLKEMTKLAPNYDSLPLWKAAQQTQRSGYPTAYARWEDQAARIVHQIVTGG